MTETVQLTDVVKTYRGVAAVQGVSVTLGAGETVALIGHNGAGKTTLMKLMLGLIRPTSGRLSVLGDDPAGAFGARSRLGYLPESVSFNLALTGRETLAFYARLKQAPKGNVGELLERVGLTAAADRRVGTYSKGMRQRLGLAQALLGKPGVLFLDEPTTGFDPALRRSFYDTVAELRDGGATVLLSSHALTELEGKADRVIIMNRGHKIADGSIEELRTIARLPTRIRVSVDGRERDRLHEMTAADGNWRRVNGHMLETDAAAPEQTIGLLRDAMRSGVPLADVEVTPPTLDEIYAHFLTTQEAAR